MSSSRRNSLLRLNKSSPKPSDSPKFNDPDDYDDAFDAEHNINNPFSSAHPSSHTSKWSLNEQWRKLQQIMEKDKVTNQNAKKEPNSQELANFTTDDLLNEISDFSIHEGEEIQEGDISYVDYSDLSQESIKNANASSSIVNNSAINNNSQNPASSTSNLNNEQSTPSTSTTTVNTTTTNDSSTTNTTTLSNSITTSITTNLTASGAISSTATAPTSSVTVTSTISKDKTFLFSKMKKNCSIERLNEEIDDKESEKELFDKRKEDSIKSTNGTAAGSSSATTTKATKISFAQQFKAPTPTKVSNIRTPTKSSTFQPGRSSTLKSRHQPMSKFKDLSEESSIDGFNTTDSSDRTNLFNRKRNPTTSNFANVDEPIPSLPCFTSFIVNLFRERLNFISFTTSFCTFFLLIFAIQLSPLSSFANGFLIGIVFSILFLIIIVIYALNYVFQKIDYENDLHERTLAGKRWEKYSAYRKLPATNEKLSGATVSSNQQSGVHEGWFFELVYSKKLGVDRMTAAEKFDYDKMPDTKLQLTYIKLEGTIMRVYVPKADQSKKINVEKVSFLKVSNKMNQTIYDYSKMKTKKIQLWLPKNIINKKKYLWSRKFPFILTIEGTNKMSEKQRTPFNLILFCRTNRDKEEWYNKFRQSIEMAEQNLQINHLLTAASTPDEVTHEQEHIPRVKSLDIGNISYEFEHLSSFLTYDTFIQDLLSQNLYSMSANNQNNNNGPTTSSQQSGNSDQQQNSNLFWFNALVGRVFFDFLTHPHWTRWVQLKIQRKLSRIKLPYFIQTIALKDVNLGTSLPKFLSVVNNPIIDEKGIWIDFDLDYQGCFSMTLETKLDLMKLKEAKAPERELKPMKSPTLNQSTSTFEYDDLSDPESIVSLSDEDSEENLSIENDARQARFVKLLDKLVVNKYFQQATDTKFLKKKMEEVSNLPILLTVNIYKLKGVLTVNLPPAPTDRLWYGFRSVEVLELESKPSFGERSIQLNPITQILSKKLKQEFHKILVLPNLDDIPLGNIMVGHEDILDNILDGEVP